MLASLKEITLRLIFSARACHASAAGYEEGVYEAAARATSRALSYTTSSLMAMGASSRVPGGLRGGLFR